MTSMVINIYQCLLTVINDYEWFLNDINGMDGY